MKTLMRYLLPYMVLLALHFAPIDASKTFNADGRYRIVVFSELRYGNDNAQNKAKQSFQNAVLSAFTPDFVALNGNMIDGTAWDGKSQTFTQSRWNQLT